MMTVSLAIWGRGAHIPPTPGHYQNLLRTPVTFNQLHVPEAVYFNMNCQ